MSAPSCSIASLIACIALIAALTCPQPAVRADAIDDYVRQEMKKRNIPGVTVAIVHHGETTKLAAYGLADVELNVPTSPQSVFQMQSVTKTFTSSAILLLEQEGKLSVDDLLSKYLDNTPESWKDIRLTHLLTHTSGIKDYINEPTTDLRLDTTDQRVFDAAIKRPLNFEPADRYSYSNTNYHLLAMIIRKLTGLSYGDFLAERFFKPLGMTHTRIYSAFDLIPDRVSGYALDGKELRRGSPISETVLGYGGGGVMSTAEDMAIWAKALAGGRVLKKETLARAWTEPSLRDGSKSNYGFGWQIVDVNGHRNISHGGAHSTGFTTHFSHFPDDELTVIVLTNARHGVPSRLAGRIAGMIEPALAVADPAPSIEEKEPAVAEQVRNVIKRIKEGSIDDKLFAPELWGTVGPDKEWLQKAAAGWGELKTLDPVSHSVGKRQRNHKYRAVFENARLLIYTTILDDGQISSWRTEVD